jgi:hypothetical protein
MDKTIAKEWVKALHSGNYKQGKGRLRSLDNTFCCLGVLCNIHAMQHPKFAKKQTDADIYEGMSSFPPAIVSDWAEIKYIKYKSLAYMNDVGSSFAEIANYIEKNWRNL